MRITMRDHQPEPREGFTLLEIAIYIVVLALLGIPLVSIMLASTRSTSENDTFSKVEERNRLALFRIEKEFRKGMTGTITLANSGRDLIFTSTSGFDRTSAVARPRIPFLFSAPPRGPPDGAAGYGDRFVLE